LHSMQLNVNGWHEKFQCGSDDSKNLNGSKNSGIEVF
jgi:hypothetical protein